MMKKKVQRFQIFSDYFHLRPLQFTKSRGSRKYESKTLQRSQDTISHRDKDEKFDHLRDPLR